MALTHGQIGEATKPRKLTAREVDETYQGEIPNTSYVDLPPSFNEVTERKRVAEQLYIERMDHYLSYFYKEMNDTALKHGMK